MAQFTVNAHRYDPYKTFMFKVKWDGQYVAGLSKMSVAQAQHHAGVHRNGGTRPTSRSHRAPPSTSGHAERGLRTIPNSRSGRT